MRYTDYRKTLETQRDTGRYTDDRQTLETHRETPVGIQTTGRH